MDFTKLLDVIRKTAAAVVPGIPAALDAAQAVLDFAESVAPTLAEDDQRALQQALGPLLAKMNADVDAAISDLKGN